MLSLALGLLAGIQNVDTIIKLSLAQGWGKTQIKKKILSENASKERKFLSHI